MGIPTLPFLPSLLLLLSTSLLLLLRLPCALSMSDPIRLGILLPFPANDNAIPVRLANEWISAVRVALEVLGSQYEDKFTVDVVVQNSNCDYTAAQQAAQVLVNESVVGVVGPACSEAVRGANSVFNAAGIPFISYAATLDEFADPQYNTFFRTVFADNYQAHALAKIVSYFGWKKAALFYTNEAYGLNLKQKISEAVDTVSAWKFQRVPFPPPETQDEYLPFFTDENGEPLTNWLDDTSIVIFAVTPNAAEGLWKAALNLGEREFLRYPWWYLGTDGTTAVDLVEQAGDDLSNLTLTIQGQIGLAPYKGNYAGKSPFKQFELYWAGQPYQEYPGLLTLPVTPRLQQTRPYVTNVIDAIWAFYAMFDKLLTIHHGQNIRADMLLDCLKDSRTNCAVFEGATGTVGFNSTTGDRRTDLSPPRYNFVNLIDLSWAEKGYVLGTGSAAPVVDVGAMMRPGPIPKGIKGIVTTQAPELDPSMIPPAVDTALAPGYDTFSSSSTPPSPASSTQSLSGGAIFGIILAVLAGLALVVGGVYLYLHQRRSREDEVHAQFVRML